MSLNITIAEYLGHYADHPDATPQVCEAAINMLERVNSFYAIAAADGVRFQDNPHTGGGVAGSGNGGFRPKLCPVGATSSTHKTGHAVDRFDPSRQFAAWCIAHQDVLKEHGLYMEDPRWTPSWVHLQDVPPKSGNIVYIPSTDPALAAMPPVWARHVA